MNEIDAKRTKKKYHCWLELDIYIKAYSELEAEDIFREWLQEDNNLDKIDFRVEVEK